MLKPGEEKRENQTFKLGYRMVYSYHLHGSVWQTWSRMLVTALFLELEYQCLSIITFPFIACL
jgi:hypothetical protein